MADPTDLAVPGFALSMYFNYRFTTLWDDIPVGLGRLMTVVVALNTISTGLNFQEIVHYGTSQKRDYAGLAGWTLADCFPALSGVRLSPPPQRVCSAVDGGAS